MRKIYQSITGRLCIISVIAFILESSKTTVNAVSVQSNKNEKRDNIRGNNFDQEVSEKPKYSHTHQKSLNKALGIIDMGHLDSNYERLRILVDNNAAEMEKVRKRNKRKSIASFKFKKFAAQQILRMLTKSCRRTNNWVCGSHGSLLTETCGDFCVPGAPQCFAFVVDIAFDVFNVLANFVPFGKVYYGVKAALRTGSKSIRAGMHMFHKSMKAIGKDILMNMEKLLSRNAWAKAFIENVALGQTGIAAAGVDTFLAAGVDTFLDLALREVTEMLAYIQMTQYMDEEMLEKFKRESEKQTGNINNIDTYQHAKLFDDSLETRDDEWGAVKNVLADMDPTGIVTIVNKFTGAKCAKDKVGAEIGAAGLEPPMVCEFDEEVLESEADDLCCSLTSESLDAYPKIIKGKEEMVKRCNHPNGDDSCPVIPGVKVRAHYTTFIDASLDFNRHDIGGSTKGMYFIISNDLQSDWNKYFPKFSEHTFCNMFEDIKYKECASAKYGFGESEENCHESSACRHKRRSCIASFRFLYLKNCMEPLGYDFNLEVKQCRRGVKIWQGNIIMYKGKFEGKDMEWHGRRFANDLEDYEWETGDTIIPHDSCCSGNLDDYIVPMKTLGTCENNPDWETDLFGCDWVARHPPYRCDKKNPFGISAYDACKGACDSDCNQKTPDEEPKYGVRVDGYEEWGNAKGTYFLVYEGWPTKAWKSLGFPMDTTNNGDKNVLDIQQFRGDTNKSPYRKGSIQIWQHHGRIFGRWKEGGRPSDWLEGDVILPFGGEWQWWEATHEKDKRSTPYETLAPVTSPPTNAPITPRTYGFIVQAVESSQMSFAIPSQERQYWNKNAQSKHGNTYFFTRCSNGEMIKTCQVIFDRNTWTGQSQNCKFLTGDVLIGYVAGWTCGGAVQSTAVSKAPTKTPTKAPVPTTSSPTKAPIPLYPDNPHGLSFNIGIEVEAEEGTSKFRIPEKNLSMWWKIQASYGDKLRQCRNGKEVWEGYFYINSLYIGRYDSSEEGDWKCGDIIIREHENCEKTQHELNQGKTVSCPTEPKAPTKTPTKAPVATTSSPTKAPIPTTSSSSGYMFYTVGKDGEDCNAACEAIGKQCDKSSIKTTTEEELCHKLRLAEVPFVGTIVDFRILDAKCPFLVDGNLWYLNAEGGNPTCSGGERGLERLCTCK